MNSDDWQRVIDCIDSKVQDLRDVQYLHPKDLIVHKMADLEIARLNMIRDLIEAEI